MTSPEPADSAGTPMPCSDAQLWMSTKIDGEEIPGETRDRLKEHLAACSCCERWFEEESMRSSQLRTYLRDDSSTRQDFEEALLEAAKDAGWDGRTLRGRRRGFGRFFRPGSASWRSSLVLLAAAGLLFAVAGLSYMDWLFSDKDLASTATEGTLSAPVFQLLIDGMKDHALQDADGRPIVQFERSHYRYSVLPADEEESENGAAGDGIDVQKSEMVLELERIEPIPVRPVNWPYQ